MARYFFDLECNGFLEECTKVLSLVLTDVDSGITHSLYGKYIEDGVWQLADADEIIGHNIIKFDVPVLAKLFGFKTSAKVTDTLVLSRFLYPDMVGTDTPNLHRLKQTFPKFPTGSHSLKAWGMRLGVLKGDFGESSDWSEWTPEMQTYCEQDVVVTAALHQHLMAQNPAPKAVELEHRFATILAMQERHGFAFDDRAAAALYAELVGHRLAIARELEAMFPPKTVETVFIPKVNNAQRGYSKGVPFTKRQEVEFNPSSRQMIAERLMDKGWEPTDFTPSGQPKVDETILSRLPYPEAKILARHFLIEKRIGQLAEGEQAWLKLVKSGRMHGSVNTNGAVTGRCTHSQPNLAQVPSVKKGKEGILYGEDGGWGAECRALFTVSKGRALVGIDLSGLELRCLAHFMAKYDEGEYAKVLLTGDIHTMNQHAAGLPTRDNAKTFIYAFLYGAGDAKIGSIVLPNGTEEEQSKLGKKLKATFLKKTPALAALKRDINTIASPFVFTDKGGRMPNPRYRPFLFGLDGRKLHIRSAHAALNTLLQSAGALISKAATIIAYDDLIAQGLVWGKDFAQVAHVHDEMQYEVREGLEEQVGKTVVEAMRKAGEFFNFTCPIDGEFKYGRNWKETH